MQEIQKGKVDIGSLGIWKNMPFEEWHMPFNLDKITKAGCPNGHCPHLNHLSRISRYDPAAIPFFDELTEGHKMLVFFRQDGKKEVLYGLCSDIWRNPEGWRLGFEANPQHHKYPNPHSISQNARYYLWWSSVRYVCLIESNESFMHQPGNKPMFIRYLSELSGLDPKSVKDAMKRLDVLNPPKPISLKPRSFQAQALLDNITHREARILFTELELLNMSEDGVPILADFILTVTQQGNFDRLLEMAPTWTPTYPELLQSTLNDLLMWICKRVPNMQPQVTNWQNKWKERFHLF